MSISSNRRQFLATAAVGGTLVGLGELSLLSRLRPVSASESTLDPNHVRFSDDIEPLVRLLEETPRAQLLEKVADRIQQGTSYREVLAALLLAGVRNVQPRPSVGHKFHAVLVVNSAHLASMSSPESDRWLPIFWALDYFKSSQARDVQEGDWTMQAVNESAVPPAHRAEKAFREAMDSWDEEAADAAVAGLARTAGVNQLFELFARYGMRDFRSIGHKAIFVANSWRTLNCIGWQYAEPVMRSLAYALLNHHGEPNPAQSDLLPDRPYRENEELAGKIRQDWMDGKADDGAAQQVLDTMRTADYSDSCRQVVELLNEGVAPQSVYDGLFLAAGEYLMRQPAIVALHAVTSTNALYYAWRTAGDDHTRRMVLLQNAAFLPLFRNEMNRRGSVGDAKVDQLHEAEVADQGDTAIEDIFQNVDRREPKAAEKTLAYLKNQQNPEALITAARRYIFIKGNNSHDYKFSSAVMEDFYNVSPSWRNHFLATSMYNLRGTNDRDNTLIQRARAALA